MLAILNYQHMENFLVQQMFQVKDQIAMLDRNQVKF